MQTPKEKEKKERKVPETAPNRKPKADISKLPLWTMEEALTTPDIWGEPWYKPHLINCFFGTTFTGKSFALGHWIKAIKSTKTVKFEWAVAMSGTAHFTTDLDYIPNKDVRIAKGYSYKLFSDIMNLFHQCAEEGKKAPETLMIFDDVIGGADDQEEMQLTKGEQAKLWKHVAIGGRRYPCTIFFLLQHMTAVPPIIRQNAKYLYLTEIHGNSEDYIMPLLSKFDIGRKSEVLSFLKSVTMRGQLVIIRTWGDDINDFIRIVSVPQKPVGYFTVVPKIGTGTDVSRYLSLDERRRYQPSDLDKIAADVANDDDDGAVADDGVAQSPDRGGVQHPDEYP